MTHKVHPKAMRIRETADWLSRGFYKKSFPEYLREDVEIRKFLEKKLGSAGIEKIEIERFAERLNVIVFCSRPGLIIGRGGEGVELLKKGVAKLLSQLKSFDPSRHLPAKEEIRIEIREIKDVWASAALVGQMVAQKIEKRMPFRRALKEAIEKVMTQKTVMGVRIQVSGRLNGVEIARREWLQKGKLPRQNLRAIIDYAGVNAYCTYGVIGIKVWIYKGEKFD